MTKVHHDIRKAALLALDLIAEDASEGLFEPGSMIDSFSTLHHHVDANEYVDQVVELVFGMDSFSDEELYDEIIRLVDAGLILAPIMV